MFAELPFAVVYSVPNVQAHLSAFSKPRLSYQAFKSGSVTASSSSWAMILAIPSAPTLSLGDTVSFQAQLLGQRSGFPTNEYLISDPERIPCVCQPQY